MQTHIQIVNKEIEEQIIIECHEIRDDISDIVNFIKLKEETITAYENARIYQISLSDIYYIDTVDNKVFVYLEESVYEIKIKLYELEHLYSRRNFFRCSKSTIVNLMKIKCITPAMNSRFIAKLYNDEEIIISRKYVSELKEKLRGGYHEI